MKSFKIVSPLLVIIPRKTKKDLKVRLNLNVYRNQHYMVENQTKKAYQELIAKQFPEGVKYEQIEVEFTMFKKLYNKNGTVKKTIIDKSNVYSVIIKYLLDALVENKIIEDDNDLFVKKEIINSTEYIEDESEERAEIIIRKYNPHKKLQKKIENF